LTTVYIERRARERGVDHDVHGKRSDGVGCDEPLMNTSVLAVAAAPDRILGPFRSARSC
jgi:hypothetical protein